MAHRVISLRCGSRSLLRHGGHGRTCYRPDPVANDPSATWTAEIFQRKLTVEPPSGSCKSVLYLLRGVAWGEQCDGAVSFKELLPFRQHRHLRCARSSQG